MCLYCNLIIHVCYAVIHDYDYVFSENGLVAHKDGKLMGTQVPLASRLSFVQIFRCLIGDDDNLMLLCRLIFISLVYHA